MSTAELRLSLIEKIMRLGEDSLEKLNQFTETEIFEAQLPAWYNKAEQIRKRHLSGDGQSSSWEEAKARILEAIEKE